MEHIDPRQLVQAGMAHHQAGRLPEAEALYRQVLASFPGNPDALHMLGLAAHHRGRHDLAVDLIRQAIRIAPHHASCYSNLGNALRAQGKLDEAIRSYRKALSLSPSLADAHQNLGNAFQAMGEFAEAIACHRQALALRPDHADGHYNLGNVLYASGDVVGAMASYRTALELRPDHVMAQNNLANALHAEGHLDEALRGYQRVLEIDANHAEALNNTGLVLAQRHQPDEAMAVIRRALVARPDYAEAWQNLGTQHEAKGDFMEALKCYEHALARKPEFATAHNNRGNALCALDRLDEAGASYERALALCPDMATVHCNLGNLWQARGDLDRAIACYDRMLELSPGSVDGCWNKAFALLLKGDFQAGWPLYEARWQFEEYIRASTPFDAPLWLGDVLLAGRTILLHHEQGLGDTLQMLRYVPVLAGQGARVLAEVPRALAAITATVPGIDGVVVQGEPRPSVDLHTPFMSLPLATATTIERIPCPMPYLFAPESARLAWRERLGPARRQRIGLAWSGAAKHSNDRRRSIALARLLPLLDADADFISVQNEYRAADQQLMAGTDRLRDVSGDLVDFAATAGLLAELDLLITVDTSVAHLAGGLGLPVWLLLPFAPDYRWLLRRADSPWYPCARLFRQPAFGDWESVVREVVAALAAKAA